MNGMMFAEVGWMRAWLPDRVLGVKRESYLAGSPGGMSMLERVIGRDQYSLPDNVWTYSNLILRLADVRWLRVVNS